MSYKQPIVLIIDHQKMEEYVQQGVLLGWLIDLQNVRVEIYRPGKPVEILEGFDRMISGEQVLEGFEFDLRWMK